MLTKIPKTKFPINFTSEFWHTNSFLKKSIFWKFLNLFFALKIAIFSEIIYFAQKTALHNYKQVSLWSGWIWSMFFSHPQKWSEFWHFEKIWILALVCTHMEIFGFEVYHEYLIEYVEAVEHNSWTFEVNFYTFSVFQTVWGILYLSVTIYLRSHKTSCLKFVCQVC